jgi:hypothetical protein
MLELGTVFYRLYEFVSIVEHYVENGVIFIDLMLDMADKFGG